VGHVKNSLKNPDLPINELGRMKNFSRGGAIVDFSK